MKERLKTWYNQQPPRARKFMSLGAVLFTLLFVLWLAYDPEDQTTAVPVRKAETITKIKLNSEELEETALGGLKKQLELLAQREKNPSTTVPAISQEKESIPAALTPPPFEQVKQIPLPPPPPIPANFQTGRFPAPPQYNGAPPGEMAAPIPQIISGVEIAHNPEADRKRSAVEDKKKAKRTFLLPPSFMEAQLLTGIIASTSGQGSKDPENVLIRIQKPAVLPNEVKARLKGCFVIAEATGRLDKERAMARLVSLTCLDRQKRGVISQEIKGWVADGDSISGLKGNVVYKGGAAAARATLAGVFGGAAEAVQSSATVQSVSPLGTTQVLDTDQIARAAIGGGLSEGAKKIADIYANLAEQASPVIEIGATKKVTVVISEAVELEVKDYDQIGG